MKQGVPSAEERDIAQAIDLLNSARSADRVLQEAQGYLRRAAVALQSRPQQAARGVTEPAQEPACDWYGSRQSNHSYVTTADGGKLCVHCKYSVAPLLAPSPDAQGVPSFEELWAVKEKEGYRYGRDALEQVRFGYDIAVAALGEKK